MKLHLKLHLKLQTFQSDKMYNKIKSVYANPQFKTPRRNLHLLKSGEASLNYKLDPIPVWFLSISVTP